MATSPEQALQKKAIQLLRRNGFYVVKVISASVRGVPDILCCSPFGRFVAIELKAPDKPEVATDLQEHNLKEIRMRDGIAFVANNLETIKAQLRIV